MNENKYKIAWGQNIAKFGALATCTAGLLMAGVALASNIHFLALVAAFDGDTVDVTGTLAGLGNKDITITASLFVEVDATCTPPGNSNKLPFGINKKLQVDEDQDIDADKFKNGSVDFSFEFDLDFDNLVKCPNNNWTKTVEFEVLEVVVTVDQQGGNDDNAEGSCDVQCDSTGCVFEECVFD